MLFFGCGFGGLREQHADPRNCLRMLSIVFSTYKLDAQTAGEPEAKWYPRNMKDVVNYNYLTEDDLKKMTNGLNVFYVNPTV